MTPTRFAALAASLLLLGCEPPPPGGAPGPAAPAPESATWHQDIAPLVSRSCSGCHAAGGIAPFALEGYEQAAPLAMAIKAATAARRMPPWMPGGKTPPLRHERTLTDAEIALFARWADDGAPLGDPAAAAPIPPPDAPSFEDPELSFDIGADYVPNGAYTDDYRCFVVDLALAREELAAAYKVTPGNRRTVHHVIVSLYSADSRAELQRLDDAEAGPGYTCFGGSTPLGSTAQQVGGLGGWVPGSSTVEAVPGTAIRLPQGSIAVVQIHYNLSGGTDPDRTRIEVKFLSSEAGPAQPLATVPLRRAALNIPPGSVDHVEEQTASAQLWARGKFYPDGDAYLVGVAAHMHTLGKRFEIVRTNLAGQQTLLEIPAWDFHWQGFYQLQSPIQLLPGDALTVRCVYDNPGMTAVRWGEGTEDEMCLGYLQVVDDAPVAP